MAKNITFERIKTYFFGFAIGSLLVAVLLVAKADMARRQLAAAEAAAASAQAHAPTPPSARQ